MKVLVAMSGGVDSSVTAGLLTEQGNECVGCTMKLYNNEDAGIPREHTCCSLDDVEDARSVAHRLGMPYYVFNFSDDFKEKVIDKFVSEYLRGFTPNPCIDCNRYMKFDKLFERADILGCDHIATGHYARIEKCGDKFLLKKAVDLSKDQSYVLWNMTQEQLSRTLFPLGELNKTETRDIAQRYGFINADKPDSQDICFVPDGDYGTVIEKYTGKESLPGSFIDSKGNVLGKHNGIIRYTIGQHRGLGISLGAKFYVTAIDAKNNTVTLGKSEELMSKGAVVSDFNFIGGEAPAGKFKCKAKVRYRQTEQDAVAEVKENGDVAVIFSDLQRAVTRGQSAVLYDGDTVIGGGTIIDIISAEGF